MKGAGTLLLTLILSGFSAPAAFATTWLSNGSASNIQALHNSARDGDTITLPAGTFFWATTVTITKGITLVGQTTTDPIHKTADDQTIILVNTGSVSNTPLINLSTTNGKSYRISGITFRTGQTTTVNSNGMIKLNGDSHAVRIDHCHFDDLAYENNNIAVWGPIYGVIDHNVFDFTSHNNRAEAVFVTQGGYGDAAWAAPTDWGSEKFVFIEDNCINNQTGNEFTGVIDDTRGGRYVLRHNHIYDTYPQSHGTEVGRYRGGRAREVYNNDFHATVSRIVGGIRSGGFLTHDNTYEGVPITGPTLGCYRIFVRIPVFGGATGDSSWDINVTEPNGTHVNGHPPYLFESGTAQARSGQTTIVDTTKNWAPNQWVGYTAKRVSDSGVMIITGNTSNTLTGYFYIGRSGGVTWQAGDQYQIHEVLIALDQPCRGQGDLIRGDAPRNSTTGTPAWPHQVLDPCYSWNNVYTPTGAQVNVHHAIGAFAVLQEGRDFYNNTPMPGYTPYTYPHPLVSGGSPTDFNDDGKPDFLLNNPITHQTSVWYMGNHVRIGSAYGPTLWPGWNVAGVADFNLDDQPDYLLFRPDTGQTAMWYLSNSVRNGHSFGPTLWPSWNVAGVADFNLDGRPDYLLFRPDTGQTAMWYLNNNVRIGHSFGPTLWPGWNVAGVADFNLDGQPDYLLFRPDTGQTAIWYLNDNVRTRHSFGPTLWPGWNVAGVADFNLDGHPDYLLFWPSTGQTAIWYLDNNVRIGSAWGPAPWPGWDLVAP